MKISQEPQLQQIYIKDLPIAMYLKNPKGIYCDCNQAFANLLGLSRITDIIGKSDCDLPWKEKFDEIQKMDQVILNSKSEQNFKRTIKLKSGSIISLLIHQKLIYLEAKNSVVILGTCTDVSNCEIEVQNRNAIKLEKKAKNALENLERVITNLPGFVYWKDKDGIYLGCNNTVVQLLGLQSSKDIIGKTDEDTKNFLPVDDEFIRNIKEIDNAILRTGIPKVNYEERPFRDRKGKIIHQLSTKVPLFDDDGHVDSILGISIDITDRKILEDKATQSLKKAEASAENLKNIIASMPGSVYWKDKNGVYLGCNESIAKVLGFHSSQDIIGKTNADLAKLLSWDPKVLESFNKVEKEVIKTGIAKINYEEVPFLDGQGKEIYQLSSKVPLFDEDGKVDSIVGISIDITDRKKLEKLQEDKVIKSEKKAQTNLANLEKVIACMPGSVFWKNKDGVYLSCNDAIANTMGLASRFDIIGKTDEELGEILSLDPKVVASFVKVDKEVITTGIPILNHVEAPFLSPTGKTLHQLSNKVPLFDENGQVNSVVGIAIDITDLKEAQAREKKALKKALLSEKQKEILRKRAALFRQISATVAHELRTPLRGIYAGVDFFEEYLPKLLNAARLASKNQLTTGNETIPERILKDLAETPKDIRQEIDASFLFINMMLSNIPGKGLVGEASINCNIGDVITDALNRYPLNDIQKQQVHVDLSYVFVFKGNHDLIVHIFFNLLKNSLYYLAAAGKGEIRIWCEEKSSMNELHFKDTGTGISKEILPHIFEQFFSKTLHGTGIGLTYCKMVMDSLDGDIICESVEGEYTEFILSFPKVSEITE